MSFFQIILNDVAPVKSPSFEGAWIVWLLGGLVSITLLGLIINKLLQNLKRPELYGLSPETIREKWAEIEKDLDHGIMAGKLAVIEADNLLDGVLRSMILPGETMGERLKAAEYRYPKIRNVWPAHKLRNQLVHDTTFALTTGQARRAVGEFHDALEVLHVL